jgi:hypothetical protein
MATLRDTIGFVCVRLPYEPHVLRLVYIVYLTDWSSAVVQGRRVTSLRWTLGAQGPEAEALAGFLASSREFQLAGPKGPSALVTFKGKPLFPTLNPSDSRIVEEIVRVTEQMDWSQVQRLIHQSDPVMLGKLDQSLDLESFAKNKRPFPSVPAHSNAQPHLAGSVGTV